MITRSQMALDLIRRSFSPIPVPYKSKIPVLKGWTDLRLTVDDIPKYWNGTPQNIGILNGEPSKGLVDADLDVPEAVRLAPFFLPPTDCIIGRPRIPGHWLYRVDPLLATAQFEDVDGTMLVEYRSTGSQTIAPGSTYPKDNEHPEEEQCTWHRDGEPAEIDGRILFHHVSRLAAAVILARHWPHEGGRQNAALALAGGLLRAKWSDDATADFVALVAEAAGDEESAKRAKAAQFTMRRIANDKKTRGWPSLAKEIGDNVVSKACEWLEVRQAAPETAPEPPITPAAVWPEPLAEDAYHNLAGDIVRAISPHTESDEAAILVQFFVALGNAIGRSAHFRVEADRHYLNLFAAIVGATAKGRKGTSWGYTKWLFDSVDKDWSTFHIQSGLSSGEGLIWAVRDAITRVEPIKEKGKPTGEYEEVTIDAGIVDKRLLVMESELASTLRVSARDGNTLSATARMAWDSGNLSTLTKNSPARATGAHISVIGHITKDELLRYFETTEMANGFGNRFLWVCARRSKCLPEGGNISSVDFGQIIKELEIVIDFASKVKEMKRDENARALWREVYAGLSEGKAGMLGAVISRAEAQVLRLSCLYALLDTSDVVREKHLKAALALWQYCEDSARFIFGEGMGDPIADEILGALRAKPDGLTKTEISRLFGRNRTAQEINRALQALQERGLIRCVTKKDVGRPAEIWMMA